MRRTVLLAVDLVLVGLTALAAGLVRDNLEIIPGHVEALIPYLSVSVATAAPILVAFGLNRAVWRYSGLADYFAIVSSSALIVSAALFGSFLINRQEGVARSLPLLHVMILIGALVGVRIISRVWHGRRRLAAPLAGVMGGDQRDGVLVVGLTALAELYIRAAAELGERAPRIEGLLAYKGHQTGRLLQQHRVLGRPEDVAAILAELDVHGVRIDRIVIACGVDKLSLSARTALLEIGEGSPIRLDFLPERMVTGCAGGTALPLSGTGGGEISEHEATPMALGSGLSLQIDPEEVDKFARRPFWVAKRLFDTAVSLVMILALTPLFVLTIVLVAADIGFPVMFWQQRPGLGGRPFRLYKFRTMAGRYDSQGRVVPDELRTSACGRFLRRTRLDELPQLINILSGDMSFVGPRPLLPIDQSNDFAARLLVRPGLTGWAQVMGGRIIGADDKAALDVWYICKASFLLDISIILATLPLVIGGERSNGKAISEAWLDLKRLGIWRGRPKVACLAPGE